MKLVSKLEFADVETCRFENDNLIEISFARKFGQFNIYTIYAARFFLER